MSVTVVITGTPGQVIARLRGARGWTQVDLAAACGVTRTAVSHWERGRCTPPIEMILDALGAEGRSSS